MLSAFPESDRTDKAHLFRSKTSLCLSKTNRHSVFLVVTTATGYKTCYKIISKHFKTITSATEHILFGV